MWLVCRPLQWRHPHPTIRSPTWTETSVVAPYGCHKHQQLNGASRLNGRRTAVLDAQQPAVTESLKVDKLRHARGPPASVALIRRYWASLRCVGGVEASVAATSAESARRTCGTKTTTRWLVAVEHERRAVILRRCLAGAAFGWVPVWHDVASRVRVPRLQGRGHLLTEDALSLRHGAGAADRRRRSLLPPFERPHPELPAPCLTWPSMSFPGMDIVECNFARDPVRPGRTRARSGLMTCSATCCASLRCRRRLGNGRESSHAWWLATSAAVSPPGRS